MIPGAQAIELLLSWGVTTALSFAVVLIDERRLSEEQLERAWPSSSRDAAIVAFGVLAVPIHFIKTRGHRKSVRGALGYVWGVLLGLIAMVVVAFVSSVILTGAAWALGLPTE